MTEALPSQVGEILAKHKVLALGTSVGDEPWVSQVFFAEEISEDLVSIYFATLKPSRKWRQLKSNSKVAFAMGTELPSQWLQGLGSAVVVEEPEERERINALIAQKAPAYVGFVASVESDIFRIEVDEIRVVDLTQGLLRTSWKKN
jgi:nitroimidazol reductase NimA-like FMN-containing flavoprotein (pyridoxamine 5'-phosphate oxidase superfamily)